MARNIEIKARVGNLDALRARVAAISDTPGEVILQEDVFFHTPRGRLKLRVLGPSDGQLIGYVREDAPGPRPSEYHLIPTTDPDRLRRALKATLGVRGTVRKKRLLYRVGRTRIHLDEVEGLGTFVEIEVVLGPDETAEAGKAAAEELMKTLGIHATDLVDVAYIDLIG